MDPKNWTGVLDRILGALPPNPRDFWRHGEGVRCEEETRPWRREAARVGSVIDAPSTRLSLVGLRPRRARLRFTGPGEDRHPFGKKQVDGERYNSTARRVKDGQAQEAA